MSTERIKSVEDNINDIGNKIKEMTSSFDNKVVELLDKIENLEKMVAEKDSEIQRLKNINAKLEEEANSLIDTMSHGYERIHGIIDGAKQNNMAVAFASEVKLTENTHANNENSNIENTNEQSQEEVIQAHTAQQEVNENNNQIQSVNANDIINVDENDDPFSLANDNTWDNELTPTKDTYNSNIDTSDNVGVEDTYLEDEYVLGDDENNDFIFADEN